jgi:hypothetical protein
MRRAGIAGLLATAVVVSGLTMATPLAAASVTLTASADTYTYPQAPGWAPGSQRVMKASSFSGIDATAWVKFPKPAADIDVNTVRATLRVPVVSGQADALVQVYDAPTGWYEDRLTHSKARDLGSPFTTVRRTGAVVEVDVTGHLRSGGPTSFALRTPGSGVALVLGTKEGRSAARLVLGGSGATTSSPSPSPTVSPSVSAGGTLFGASVPPSSASTWSKAVAKADNTFGRLGVIRVFYPNKPLAWPGRAGSVKRPVVVSFKLPFGEILAGKHDTSLRRWFDTAPTGYDVYWSLHHEPEDDIERGRFTSSQYRAAWRHVSALESKTRNQRLHSTLIIMNHSFGKGSGRDVADYYPGNGVLDVVAVDAYNTAWRNGQFRPAEAIVGPIADFAAAKGLEFGIAELGSREVAGDASGQRRAAWLREVAAEARQRGASFVTYWNAKGANADYRLTDSASISAWRQAVATSGTR